MAERVLCTCGGQTKQDCLGRMLYALESGDHVLVDWSWQNAKKTRSVEIAGDLGGQINEEIVHEQEGHGKKLRDQTIALLSERAPSRAILPGTKQKAKWELD
jgi:hypothetical protein